MKFEKKILIIMTIYLLIYKRNVVYENKIFFYLYLLKKEWFTDKN